MAVFFYGTMREPLPNDEAPLPSRCSKCNSTDLGRAYHRDLIACLLLHDNDEQTNAKCGGEHLHWQCRDCGYDFTSPCAGGDDD